jgi:hypothetical protein
MPNKK